MTSSTLTRLAPTQVELEIPISDQELADASERAFRRLAKNAKIPGFRAGKIPRKVFEQNYGTHSIEQQAMDDVVPQAYARAVREHDIEPVDRPKMEFLPTEEGKPTRFKATVEVRPAFDLGTYKGVDVERPAPTIGDDDVERSIAALARERATLVPVDRAAELGDVLTLDYEGKIDGTPFEGGTAQGQMTELEERRFIPGFATGIAGMRAGETKDIEATFPDDYAANELAGKTAIFTVTVHDVKAVDLPALDDAFAQSISESQTFEALRDDVRKRLEGIAENRARRAVGNAVMEKLLASHEFPLPETMVEREIESMVSDAASQVGRSGGTFEKALEESGKTLDGLRDEYRDDAQTRVKGTLIIEAIAKAEKIEATPADIAAELASLARQYGQPVERIREALGNNVLSLVDGIVRNKTLEFLIDHAVVRDSAPEPSA